MGPYQSSGPRAKGLTQGAVYEMVTGGEDPKDVTKSDTFPQDDFGQVTCLSMT